MDLLAKREKYTKELALYVRVGLLLAAVIYVFIWMDIFFSSASIEADEWGSLLGLLWMGVLLRSARKVKSSGYELEDMLLASRAELEARMKAEDLLLEGYKEKVSRIKGLLREELVVPVFQPIVDLRTGECIAVEALSRFSDEGIPPQRWFSDAHDLGLSPQFECLAMRKALDDLDALPPDCLISMNLGPETLTSESFADLLEETAPPMDRLIFEITEHALIEDYERLIHRVDELRARGAKLAVDDVGAGYSSLTHLLRLQPEIVKLDRSLIQDIHAHPSKEALVRSFIFFGASVGAMLVAEGVESKEEAERLRSCGVNFAQGYLICKPIRPPIPEFLYRPDRRPPLRIFQARFGQGSSLQ